MAPRRDSAASPSDLPALIPPHNLDAEMAVLGCVLLEGAALAERLATRGLSPEDFYLEKHRITYRAMLALARSGHAVSLLTLTDALRHAGDSTDDLTLAGGPAGLMLLVEQAALEAHVDDYARIVLRDAIKRAQIIALTRAVSDAYNGHEPGSLSSAVAAALALIDARSHAVVTVEPLPTVPWAEIATMQPVTVPWVVPGWVAARTVNLITGPSGSAKSFLALTFGACTGAGVPALDAPAQERAPVLYLSAENGIVIDMARIQAAARTLGHDLPIECNLAPPALDPNAIAQIEALCRRIRPRLIVLDSASELADLDGESENNNAAVTKFIRRLRTLATEFDLAIVLIHHDAKPPREKGAIVTDEQLGRGATAWRNAVGLHMAMKRLRPGDATGPLILRHTKARYPGLGKPCLVHVDPASSLVQYEGPWDPLSTVAQGAALAGAVAEALTFLRAQVAGLYVRPAEIVTALVEKKLSKNIAARAVRVLRGREPWPEGTKWAALKHSVVDETPGKKPTLALRESIEDIIPADLDDEPGSDDPPF